LADADPLRKFLPIHIKYSKLADAPANGLPLD